MLAAGARVSHHLRECDSQFGFGLTSGLTSFPVVLFPPIWSRKPTSNFPSISRRSQPRGVSFFCSIIPSTSPGEIPVISDSFGYFPISCPSISYRCPCCFLANYKFTNWRFVSQFTRGWSWSLCGRFVFLCCFYFLLNLSLILWKNANSYLRLNFPLI